MVMIGYVILGFYNYCLPTEKRMTEIEIRMNKKFDNVNRNIVNRGGVYRMLLKKLRNVLNVKKFNFKAWRVNIFLTNFVFINRLGI